MANTLFSRGRQALLRAEINWDPGSGQTFKVCLVDTGSYTPNFSAHQYLSDVTAGAIKATQTLASLAVVDGAADADDVTFPSVSAAVGSLEAILIYKDTGVAGTSILLAWIDTATGLPITANGGDIIVVWDAGPNRIFRP